MVAPLQRRCIFLLTAIALVCRSAAAFETVVIDPGHGGGDEGTEWRHVSEKDLTLAVARRLEDLLRAKKIHTVLTRHCDSFVSLDERAQIANLFPGSLLVSIHFNGSRMNDIRGFEVYSFRASPSSRVIAESIQSSLANALLTRNRGLRTDQDYAVLVRTAGLAVLVECGFISNKKEADQLSSPEGQQRLAEALAEAILRVKPVINTDPPEADIVRCEIHARKHEEALRKEDPEAFKKMSKGKKAPPSGSRPRSRTGK